MATLTIAPQNIPPGATRRSATRTIPAVARDISVQLTDLSGSWAGTVGNILVWGVQTSSDGGANWTWLVWQPGRQDAEDISDGQTIPFGTLSRFGNMPSLGISSTAVLAEAGNLARLAIRVDTAIQLGATVTV